MKDQKTTPETGGQVRTTFTFDPSKLSISELYATQLFDNGGYESARIFANGVMQARLLLKYSYKLSTEDFPETTPEDDIIATVKAAVEPYLQSTDYLKVYEAANSQADITANGWGKVFTGNEYLFDLDNASSINPPPTGQDAEITTMEGEDIQEVSLVFDMYVTPPPCIKLSYSLIARYSYTDTDGIHSSDSSAVSLHTEVFDLTKDDLELQYIASGDGTFKEGYGYRSDNNCILFALAYKGEKYGAARLNNITSYRGVVLDPAQTNICITHASKYQGLAGIFYYPSTKPNVNQLSAGDRGTEYESTLLSINTDAPFEGQALMKCNGVDFEWIQSFTEAQVARTHQKGIPMVISYRDKDPSTNNDVGGPLSVNNYTFNISLGQRPLYFKMQDTCGNAIEVRFYDLDDRDKNLEYCYNKTNHYSETNSDNDKRSYQRSEYDPESDFSKWSSYNDDGTALLKIRRAGPCLP